MTYTEVTINFCESINHKKDIIIASLSDLGFEGFIEEDNRIIAYIPETQFNYDNIQNHKIFKENKELFSLNINTIAESNWNAIWENNFNPVIIQDCIIRAPFHKRPENINYDIIIEPKMSFGTGHHETTSMIVQGMLKTDFVNKAVLDMGSGTGILAILACMKKAKFADAVDNDEWAFENALENCKKNHIDNCNVIYGSIEEVNNNTYDIIIANITRNVLLELLPYFDKMQKNNALLFLSGFLIQDITVISEAAKKFNYIVFEKFSNNNWSALTLKKE